MKIQSIAVLVLFSCSCATGSKENSQITQPNTELAKRWSVAAQAPRVRHLWTTGIAVPGQNMFLCILPNGDDINYYYIAPETKTKTRLLHSNMLRKLKKQHPGLDLANLAINEDNIRFNNHDQTIDIDLTPVRFRYHVDTGVLEPLNGPGNEASPGDPGMNRSPDGKWGLFTQDDNLFIKRLGSSNAQVFPVTEDCAKDYTVNQSTITWSADSRYVACVREDWRQVADLWHVNHYSNPRPTLETYKWPMPNEPVEQHELLVYDVTTRVLSRINTDRWPDQDIHKLRWDAASAHLYFTRMSRDWHSLDLCRADVATGTCDTLIEERGYRQVIFRPSYKVLASTGEILWWSMRDDWGAWYLHAPDGTLKHAVASGAFHCSDIAGTDEARRRLFFMGTSRDPKHNPYYHYLYGVNLDGSDLVLLTPEAGEHEIVMTDTCDYFIDNYSRPDLAPRAAVKNRDGRIVMPLDDADISGLLTAGWKPPQVFSVKAADGKTDLWGVMYTPYDLDPQKKYPVVTYGYPGKESEYIPMKFYRNSWVTLVSVSLAQNGFIVVVSGNRGGSLERSYDYYTYSEPNLRDYCIADKRVVIEQLAKRHPYMDLERIGIMGQSSGGFMAAAAILQETDFFKVAVAKSGNHDNNLYYHIWNERYGDVTQTTTPEGETVFQSKTATTNDLAANLKGRLLLVHGDMDRFVPLSLTSRLAHDLMMANKRFDMFIMPHGDHFFGDNWQYLICYIELYFIEHLMQYQEFNADILD